MKVSEKLKKLLRVFSRKHKIVIVNIWKLLRVSGSLFNVHKELTELAEDSTIAGVVFTLEDRVFTVEGNAVTVSIDEAANIAAMIHELSKKKPVIAYLSNKVDMYGYLIVCGCNEIVAADGAALTMYTQDQIQETDPSAMGYSQEAFIAVEQDTILRLRQGSGKDFNLHAWNFSYKGNNKWIDMQEAKIANLVDTISTYTHAITLCAALAGYQQAEVEAVEYPSVTTGVNDGYAPF